MYVIITIASSRKLSKLEEKCTLTEFSNLNGSASWIRRELGLHTTESFELLKISSYNCSLIIKVKSIDFLENCHNPNNDFGLTTHKTNCLKSCLNIHFNTKLYVFLVNMPRVMLTYNNMSPVYNTLFLHYQ